MIEAYKIPEIIERDGKKCIRFNDGTETMDFVDITPFDENTGCFGIVSINGVVEAYMDLFGMFYSEPSKRAKQIYEYLKTRKLYPYIEHYEYNEDCHGFTKISPEYLLNVVFLDRVKQEEQERMNMARANGQMSLIGAMSFKYYVNKHLAKIVKQARKAQQENKADVEFETMI